MDLVTWMQQTGVHRWLAETPSYFPYPFTLFLHSSGMGIIAGLSLVLDLRILGGAPGLPLAPLERLFPLMWLGFVLNAISGVGLAFADPAKLLNWIIWIKFTCLALALVTLVLIRREVFHKSNLHPRPLSPKSKVLAVASIFFWVGTIWAGRFSAYLGA